MKDLASHLIRMLAISYCVPAGVYAGEIELNRKWKLYEVNGRNRAELRRELNSKGPVNPDSGKRFDARTDWKLGWEYKYEMKQGKYRLSSYSIKVAATIHFPKWVTSCALRANQPSKASESTAIIISAKVMVPKAGSLRV